MGLWSLSSVLSQSFFSLYHFFNYFFFYPLQSVILDIVSSGSIFPTLYLFSHNFSFFFYFIFWVNSSAYSFNLPFQFSSFFLLVFNCWIDFSIIVYFCTFFVAVFLALSLQYGFKSSLQSYWDCLLEFLKKVSVLSCLDIISLRSSWFPWQLLIILITSSNFLLCFYT